MSKTRRGLSFLLCLLMVFSLFAGMPIGNLTAQAATSNTNPGGTNPSGWVTAWHTSMMWLNGDSSSNISTAVNVLSALRERTFRTRIQTTMGGNVVQLTYSNEYGTKDLQIGEISIAQGNASDVSKISTSKFKAVTACWSNAIAKGDVYKTTSYYGDTVYAIRAGHTATTDPIDISAVGLKAMDYVTVSTWITNMNEHDNGITGGLIGGITKYLGLSLNGSSKYNHTHAGDLGDVGIVPPIELANSDETGDYNIIPFLKEIDVRRDTINGVDKKNDAYTTVIFGDSTLANDIPTLLGSRLKTNNVQGVSFVWAAIKGNEFLLDGQSSVSDDDKNGPAMGESGLNRAYKDALNLPGVKKVIVKLGINDILHPYCTNMNGDFNHKTTAKEIIAAYKQFIDMAHDKGIEVYFYELTPWNGYTRNGYLTYSDSIDAVRREVNAWLAKYGKAYDEFATIGRDTNSGDGYTGTVNFGANYGSASHTQNCDKVYQKSPSSVNGPKSYTHGQAFDTFGYIALDEMCSGNKLIGAFTTDGIHYTKSGMSKVSNLTPLSIFWNEENVEVSTAGEKVQIHNIFTATKTGVALDPNETYYIVDNIGYLASKPGDLSKSQEYTGNAATAPDFETSDADGKHYRDDAVSHIYSTPVVIQRGTDTNDVPYIVSAGITNNAQWTVLSAKNDYFWVNTGTNRFMAWYYPAGGTTYGRFSLGTKAGDPRTESSVWSGITSGNKGWYTFNKIGNKSDNYASYNDGNFGNIMYYDGSISDKALTCYNGSWQVINTSSFSTVKFRERLQTLVFFNKQYNTTIDCTLDIDTQNVNGTSDGNLDLKNTIALQNSNASFRLYYVINSNLAGDQHINAAALNNNGNNPVGPFAGYTYGYGQEMYWMSSNKTVATVDKNKVVADANGTEANSGGLVQMTGNPGETLVTLNFFWKDYDKGADRAANDAAYFMQDCTKAEYEANCANNDAEGVKWVQVDNDKYVKTNYHWLKSEVEIMNVADMNCDILIDNNRVDTYEVNNVVNGMNSSLEAVKIAIPETATYPDGKWVWSISGDNIGTLSQANEYASINYNGNSGTATVTLKYVDASNRPVVWGGHEITSTVEITTHAKPLTAEIQINGKVDDNGNPVFDDSYVNLDAELGDTVNLKAIKTAGVQTITGYTWKVYNEELEEGSNVIALTGNGENASFTVTGEGTAIVLVDCTYTDNGETKHAYDYITVVTGLFTVDSNSVVVDFALPVNIDLSKLAGGRTVNAISADSKGVEEGKLYTAAKYNATSVQTDNYNATLENSVMAYEPVKITDGSIDTVYYQAKSGNGGFKCNHVEIIPATSVYYEDSFVTLGEFDNNWNFTAKDGVWQTAGSKITGKSASVNKDVFGYDEAYGQYTQFSMGSARYVTVDNTYGSNLPTYKGSYPAASFTFKGTGFAVYSTSDTNAGYVDVEITGTKGYYKYEATNAYATNDFDQTPTLQYLNLPYDTYTVTLSVVYDKNYDGNKDGSYTYYLDAVRIYEPMKGNADAEAAYAEVGESNASFKSIRGMLIDSKTFNGLNGAYENGAVFLDSDFTYEYGADGVSLIQKYLENTSVSDYKNFGPKNEVYLSNGQGVAFNISNAAKLTDVQVGIKQAGPAAGTVTINGKAIAITTATDMYYSIKDLIGADGNVVIANAGTTPISITVLKTTSDEAPVMAKLSVSPDTGAFAAQRIMMFMAAPVEPETTDPVVEPTDPVVEPTDDPQPTDPVVEPTDDPQPTDPVVEPTDDPQPTDDPGNDNHDDGNTSFLAKILNAVKNFFGKLFGGK